MKVDRALGKWRENIKEITGGYLSSIFDEPQYFVKHALTENTYSLENTWHGDIE